MDDNLTDKTNLSYTLTRGLLVACDSWVSIEKNLIDRTKLNDTLTGSLIAVREC